MQCRINQQGLGRRIDPVAFESMNQSGKLFDEGALPLRLLDQWRIEPHPTAPGWGLDASSRHHLANNRRRHYVAEGHFVDEPFAIDVQNLRTGTAN